MKLPGVLSKLATPLDRLQVRTRQTLNMASTGSVHLKQPRDRKITRIILALQKNSVLFCLVFLFAFCLYFALIIGAMYLGYIQETKSKKKKMQ